MPPDAGKEMSVDQSSLRCFNDTCSFVIIKTKSNTPLPVDTRDVFRVFATSQNYKSNTVRCLGNVDFPGRVVGNSVHYNASIRFQDEGIYKIDVLIEVASMYAGADLPCCASEECVNNENGNDYILHGARDWSCSKCCKDLGIVMYM